MRVFVPFTPAQPKYVPKHRAPGKHKAKRPSVLRRSGLGAARTTIALTGVAAAVTGVGVAGGMLAGENALVPTSADISAAAEVPALTAENVERREKRAVVSRSDRRGETDATKVAALSAAPGHAVAREVNLSEGDPRDIARELLPRYGFDSLEQYMCLDALYVSESNWRVDADNPTSSAYGIPQALTQTHDLPAGYMTSAEVQIRWGLEYIQSRYGTPCNAWSFKRGHNWY